MTKNTYGTGSFVLMNVGETCPDPIEGLLTTVAWTIPGRIDGHHDALRIGRGDLRHGRGGAVAARRARLDRRCRPRSGRSRRRSPTPRASCSCPRSPAWVARGGIRTPAARWSASPAVPAGPTSPEPSSRPWRSRHATWSRPWWRARVGRWPRYAPTAARRSWTCCCNCRPTNCRCPSPDRRYRRPPRWARPTSPGWPKACGTRPTTSPTTGYSTPRYNRRSTADEANVGYEQWKRARGARPRLGRLLTRRRVQLARLCHLQLTKPSVDDPRQRRRLAPLSGSEHLTVAAQHQGHAGTGHGRPHHVDRRPVRASPLARAEL